jgi:cell division septum initiation protein DivIVA
MNPEREQFRTVLRGYAPAEVDRRLGDLTAAGDRAQQQIEELSGRVRELEEDNARLLHEEANNLLQAASFAALGERVGQILSLAEAEAADMRASAVSHVEAQRLRAEEAAGLVHGNADMYAQQVRSSADADAAKMLEEARRRSDELIDEAERNATARIQEAEAVFERQRAKAAQAAADFETTLAKRRDQAEQEFSQHFTSSQQQLAEVQTQVEESRSDVEKLHSDAEAKTRRLVEDAQQQASEIVAQGRAHVDRIRAESDRELAAASQRRDSINAQLTNVREMLATLSGLAPGIGVLDPGLPLPADTSEEQPGEAAVSDGREDDEDASDADLATTDDSGIA